MPSQRVSSESTSSVVAELVDVAAEEGARAGRAGVALGVRAVGDAAEALAARAGSARNATSSSGPQAASATRRATRFSSATARSASGVWLTRNAPSATSKVPSANGSVLGVGLDELEVRVAPAGLGDHPAARSTPVDVRAALGRGGGERAGPAADVEHAHPRPHVREQRRDRDAVARAISAS